MRVAFGVLGAMFMGSLRAMQGPGGSGSPVGVRSRVAVLSQQAGGSHLCAEPPVREFAAP